MAWLNTLARAERAARRGIQVTALAPVAHEAGLVALPVALLFGFALVVKLLALGDAELAFGDALGVEIERSGMSVMPSRWTATLSLAASPLCTRSFRARRGSWLKRFAMVYSGM